MERKLPDFASPPVVEVALAVQFDPLASLRSAHLGLYWQGIRDRFPLIEEHAPLDPMLEYFGARPQLQPAIQIQMATRPPTPRCWFLNERGTELIQIQQDRFAHNWRKRAGDEPYPRYEYIRESFERELGQFARFLAEQNVGELAPNLCEVLYVNHIPSGEGWQRHGELAEVLAPYGAECTEKFLPEPEQVAMRGSFVIPGRSDEPLGRLRFEIDPGYRRSDNQPIFRLNMVARGRPDGEGMAGVMRFLDTGREWIVRGFAALTTRKMHGIWERRQ